jgi:hypothetical protein
VAARVTSLLVDAFVLQSVQSSHRYGEAVFQHQKARDLRIGERQDNRKCAIDQFSGCVDPRFQMARE